MYNDGVVVYNDNNKKKSLLTKLRNKMILPSKNTPKEYLNADGEETTVVDEQKQKSRYIITISWWKTIQEILFGIEILFGLGLFLNKDMQYEVNLSPVIINGWWSDCYLVS